MVLKQAQEVISEKAYLQAERLAEHYFFDDGISLASIGLHISVTDLYYRGNNDDMRNYRQQLAQQAN